MPFSGAVIEIITVFHDTPHWIPVNSSWKKSVLTPIQDHISAKVPLQSLFIVYMNIDESQQHVKQ